MMYKLAIVEVKQQLPLFAKIFLSGLNGDVSDFVSNYLACVRSRTCCNSACNTSWHILQLGYLFSGIDVEHNTYSRVVNDDFSE